MGTAKILIASNNPDKIKEMKAILSDNFETRFPQRRKDIFRP